MLGLTVSCARCHDHKFDPISTREYYGLVGVFASSEYVEVPLVAEDVVGRYDTQQAGIKQAEERLKVAQADEARKLGESFAPQTAAYLTATWKVQNRRKQQPDAKLGEAAREAGLHEFLLDRWLQFIAADSSRTSLLFAPWRELLASQDATRDWPLIRQH